MDLLDCLPHQPPLRLLEQVTARAEREVAASFLVAAGALLDGPALWSGAAIEALAQTAALLGAGLSDPGGEPAPIRGLLVGLRGLELGRAPVPGERVDCVVRLVTRLGGGVLVAGEARVGEELVARGRLQFVMEPAA